MKRTVIRKVEVTSVAVFMAIIYAVIGFIVGLFFFLFGGIFAAAMEEAGGVGMGALGAAGMIIFPFFYAFIGFIMGAVIAIIFNVFAKMIGGLAIWLDMDEEHV